MYGLDAFSRGNAVHDTTIGWRFVNPEMRRQYGVDAVPETAEIVATDFRIDRQEQDLMALASQQRAAAAQQARHQAREITPVHVAQKKGDAIVVDKDEQAEPLAPMHALMLSGPGAFAWHA